MADVPSGLSLTTPPQETKKKYAEDSLVSESSPYEVETDRKSENL
jgi:hypothetical protein